LTVKDHLGATTNQPLKDLWSALVLGPSGKGRTSVRLEIQARRIPHCGIIVIADITASVS
jgi:hypothetical protein